MTKPKNRIQQLYRIGGKQKSFARRGNGGGEDGKLETDK